jgi:NAD(P)-dependent dehydrogenase (short-subunit alcohol dehydrogenase family)
MSVSRLEGRVAVVTGASRGIGIATVERLALEGASVVFGDVLEDLGRESERRLRDQGLQVRFHPLDVTDDASAEAFVAATLAEFGAIDVLVNNAAIFRPGDLDETTADDFAAVFAVNVTGMFRMTRLVTSRMIAAGRSGAVVNLSSITAAQGAPGLLAYSSSKGAISALTRSLAVALSEHGIRVNAVGPGLIGTENTLIIHATQPEQRRQVLSRTPLRRAGEPAEVASVIAFLASDDSSYMTGQVVYPDGGRLALSYTVPVTE